MGCISGLKCERRRLFSCRHFEWISEFLFRRVFCDGYVMMANFSWRQRRHFLDVLQQAGACFSISQVIVGDMFAPFSCHVYEDKEVLDA